MEALRLFTETKEMVIAISRVTKSEATVIEVEDWVFVDDAPRTFYIWH